MPFPHPNDASDAINPLVSEIFLFEIVYRRTDTRTDGRRLNCYPISSPLSLRLRRVNYLRIQYNLYVNAVVVVCWCC